MNTTTRRATLISALLAAPLLCTLVLAPTVAQAVTTGSGRLATEARNVAAFEAIATAGSIDLTVRQGAQQVQVQADDNLLPLLETVVESGKNGPTLLIRWKKGESLYTRSKVHVTVSLPALNALSAAGSGDIRLESYSTPALQLSLSGSGDARLDKIETASLAVRISGSSDVRAAGRAAKLSVNIAGSGDVQLADLRTEETEIAIAGSGDAVLNVDKSLDVRIAGSGDVVYTGNAAVRSKVAGSGSVTKR